jgi:tape measure domain-containing protein
MELPQLVVELVGDYSKLMEDIKKARVEAIKQAQFLEKDLNLTIGVNDDSLKNLNKHFDLKVTHFKQTQTYFKNNPLKVFVDDGELTNLNKELDKLGQRKVTANVSVNNNGSGNKNNTVGDVVKGVIMSPVNMAANIAMSPFRAVGKVADAIGKGIDNIAVGFTEEIGRSMSIKLTGKSTKEFAKKIQDGFRLVDEEIIGKSQVYETFFAELISSGSFDKAKFAAGKRTKMQKQLNRLGDLQVIANLEEEYKSNKNTPSSIEAVDRILSEEPELKKKFETISSKKSSLSLDEHKRRFIPTIIKEAQPTDLSNKVILPLMKEVQPILNFIQGMQSYHTSKLSESHYQARKATFPILEPGQKVVSVIGGAEDKFGQGGRALATSLEPIVGKNIKLLPVENLDTDVSKRTAEIDKWTDDVLIKKLLPGMGSLSPTIKNAVRQIAYSLNPLGSDVAAAQALAHTRLAREQGNDASAISFSLGGASAYRYAKAAEYEGTKTKALAMAYPFSNLSNATPKGFASAILEKDPLTFPFKIGVYNPSSAMNILDDSGLRSSGANVHATHHLFRSPGFVEKFNDTVGSSLPTDKTSRDTMSDLQRLMLQVHQVVISTMHAKDLASKGQYSQGVIKNLFDSKYLFGQLSNERMPEQVRSMATILRGQAVDAGTLMLSNAEKTERPTGQLKDLPNDESHPGYQRYKQEASVINQSIESFKTRTVVPGAYFAGGLKREDVAARNQELSQKTIPWFKSQKQFEEYGREIIKGLEIVAKLQEEFVRTHGNISPKFLDKIDYLPTENLKTDVMEKIKFPDNVTDPGFMRYVNEVSGINESIQTFKENKAIPDKGWWAGGLNVGKVAERKRDLSIATIPWFESQKQFEEYGKKIVQGFKVILSLQEEFIKTKGNISPDFLDKIEYLPTIPGSEKIPKYASEQSPEFRNLSEYFEENLNLKKLPISDAMREHPASILGFNKMLKTIAPMMPDAKEIKAVGHGWSGAMALITDKLVYKTDLDPEGAKKIASKQEVKAYERLQGRYAPLLYAANEKESMIVEKIEGRDLKRIMEDYAAPIRASKEEQAKLKKETKPRIAKLENELENEKNPERRKEIKKAIEDLENANKLLDRQIRKDIKQFNEIFSQFYRHVGSLGRALQDMGVAHNDLASANVFFKDYKIDPVTNKVDPGKISAIDLGMSTTMPSAKQKAEDEATTIQRALIDISLWGILDANKIRNSIKKGYKKALPIPEARQIDPSLLIPLNPAKEIPIGYSGKSLLQETVGDLPQFKPTAILPTYTVEKSYTPTPVSTIPKGYQVIKVNPVTQSTSVSATPNGYQVTRVNPVTQSTSGKDIEVSEKAKLAVKSAQELAAKFNANFAKLRSLLKDAETTGNFAPVIELSAAIKQYGDKAKADITKLRNSAGIDPNFAKSRESSQLSNSLSQITSVQNKAARISALHGGVRIGENIGAGVSEGVKNSIGDLRTAAEKLADIVPDVVTEKLKMQSPSKVMEGYGENTGDGYGIGLENSLDKVKEIAKSGIDDVAKTFDFVNQDPKLNGGEELTNSLRDWYLSHRTSFDPSRLNNILGSGLMGRPPSNRAARELELFGRSGTLYSALRHKEYGADRTKNEAYGAIEFLIDPSRIANKTTWLQRDSNLDRYQSIEELKEDYEARGSQFRQLSSVSPKANLMRNYEENSGYVEAQTHVPVLPSDISAIRIGSSQISSDQLFKKYGDSLLAFIRTALSKNIKVIGDFNPEFLKAAESAGININKGLSEGIRKSANKPVEAIGEVAHKTVKATEGYPAPIQQVGKKPPLSEAQQAMVDEFNKQLAALQGTGKNVGGGLSEGIDDSLKNVKSSSEKLANTVINTVEEKLEIKSPSRWGIRTGQNIGNAMGVGADESLNNAKKIITSRVDEIRKGAENGLVLPSGYNKLPHINKGSLANLPINGLLQPSSGVDSTRLNSPRTTSVFSAPTGEFSKLYNPNISTEELRKTFAKQISKNLSSVVSTDEINRSLGLSPVILPDSYAKYKKQNNVSPIITSSSQLNPYSGSIPLANPLKPYQGLILPNNNNSNNGNNLILPGQRSGSGLPLILPPEKQPHVVRLTEAQESFKNVLLSAGNAVTNFSLILPRGRGWSSPNPLTTLAASGRMGWAQGGYNSILPKNIPQPSYQSLILPNSNQNPSRHLILPNSYVPPIPQVPQPSISFKIPNTTVGGVNPQLPPFLPNGIPQVPQSTIENGVKKNSQSFVRLGIMLGKYVGEGFTKGLQFLEGGNNGIIPSLIRQINRIKESVENGTITSDVEKDKERLSRGFSKGLGSIPGFKEAKERFKGYLDFLKEIANPNVSAALGEGLANGIVAAKELFVDFLKMPEKIKEGFIQAKVAFDSFVEGMSKVQKFGEMMDFVKSSIGNVVKVLALLAVGKIILDLAPASIEVAANFENLERRIKFTSGSISEGAKNIAFLRSEAKRLNVDLSQTLESGSKFFQATKDTPIEGYQSRQIVSAVTQASAVYGLDLDKQQRTFTALEQMSGKTVVSQEELRQQLAEAIPNASQIAANAYGTTTQSMNQLLSTGRVLAEDFLPKFAQQLKAQTSSGVGDAVNSSVAITNKFNNSLIELQESIGKTLLPFRNFSLSVFASGIDLVTKNLQLLKSVLLITLIKLGSPVWLMFATYLKGILFSAGGAKGALLGMSQSIATLAAQMFVLSMAMKAIDETMMNFKDNSGAIGEQTRNVTQSINEQRKLLNPSSKVSRDDFSAFRERFTLNPFDNDTKKLIKQMEDSAKQTTIGQQNTFDILKDSNSPAIQDAIQEIQAIDKSLDDIKMKRRAVIANNPGDIQQLRELQEQEKELSQRREKPLELFGGTKANLDKQVETLKTYLEYWEELKKNPKLYQSEIEQINQIIKVTKQDLATVIQEQDKMTKAIKNSLTEMQKFAIEIRNLEAKFNDLRQYRDTALSLEKTNLFNLGSSGDVLPGQLEYTNNLKTQATLTGKIADNLKQIQEMSAQLEVNDLDGVLNALNLNKRSGIDTLKAAQERSIDGSKEKEILSGFIKVKEMQIQTVDMQQQIAEQKYNLIQSLYQQTKQVTDYYRVAVRESQAVGLEFEKAQKTFENSKVQNKLREALIGAGDNIYTQFIEGIINVISQTTEIEKQQLEARKQRIDYQNNVQDIQLQAIELQRSLPGKIIPIDSSIADNFNLSLKNVNRTVDEINKNINNLSNSVVDATKKAEDGIKGLSKTSNSWIEGLGTKFADLVKSFENGFDRVGTAIADMGIKTSNWLASLYTGQGLLQNLAGGVQSAVSTVFGEKAGQQLEQGAKEFVSNPIGALKQFYGVDNNSTPSTRLKAKGKVGFVENSSSSIDSARGHIGDDIFAPIGSKIFSPLAGTVVQSRVGGTKNTDDANPLVPGYQPQQLVIIKLDMPIEFEGKKITHLNMRHLLDRNVQVGQKVKTGDLLGTVGEAGGRGTQFGTRNPGTARDADAAHLHIEYAPSENNQRNSLPDSQASRLTAKLSKEYSGGVQNTVNTPKTSRNRQPVPKVPLVPGLDPRIDTKFLQSVAKIAQSVGANPEDLLKTMLYETGGTLSPSARNKRTNATGLIQFMPATARGLGTNIDALSQMSPQEQLVFVQKYLKQNSRGQKLDSFRKVLSTVFAGNPNASLGVGDGDITLGNYLPKAENRYGNTARQLVQIVMQGGSIQPNQMQQAVTQASRLKLNTAAQQYQTNQINSNLNPEQIKENELKQRLEAYRLIMSSQKGAIGDISSTKDSTLGTRITVLKGLSPNMSNADMFSLQFNELRRKLEKDVESLEQIVRETDGAIAQKPDLQAAFNLAMKRFPNDPRLAAAAIQTNDLSFKATAFKNAEAKNSLKFLKSNIDSILKASMKDFDKKEFFRLSEQDISQQSKVIEQLQQQLQLVQKLEEIDPLNPLVLKIPSLQRNISLLELTRDQYQQLLDLQRRYYDGGGKGGNMSEAAFQKEFKAILNVNSVKREGVDLNFNYADTVKRIKQANDELTKSQTIQASQMKSLQLDNERFAIDNKDGMVSLVSLTNELTIKTNELTNAYKKQLLEIQGNTLLSPQEKLIERLKAFRNYGKEKSNLDAENSYQTKLAPITNRGIELGRMEKLNSSGSAISSEIIRGRGLFGVRDKELQKAQLLSQIKMDFEKEKNEIAKLGLSSNYSAEEISVLSENLLKLNELKLDNVAKEFNMFTEAISGIKGDFDNILKGFFMNDSVNKNAGDLQDINKSLDEIAKKRRDIIMNTSGNIQEVRNAYQNSGNNKQLKELDRAQRDLEKKKTELSKRSIVDAFSEIAKSILSNLAAVASKELSNQLFGKLTEIIFGNKAKDVGAIALNNAGANLSMSATMLQQAALALQNIMGAGSKDGGVLDSIFGAFGESSFGVLEGSSAIPFSSSGAFDFSDGFSLGGLDGGLDFGSATLPSFAKGGMVGDLLNKERAISGFNPRLIIANEGERVLTPKETKLWNQLNSSNKLESFSSGGMIGEGLGNINNVGRSGDTINITPNVNINNSEGGNGNINKALFEKALEAKIQETIKQERRPGGSLNRGGLYDR